MKILFVHFIPEPLEKDTLYISTEYGAVLHLCPCGCGLEVSTPIKPTWENGWDLIVNGDNVSLSPSISNYQHCKSHYFITNNQVVWC